METQGIVRTEKFCEYAMHLTRRNSDAGINNLYCNMVAFARCTQRNTAPRLRILQSIIKQVVKHDSKLFLIKGHIRNGRIARDFIQENYSLLAGPLREEISKTRE